MVAGHFAVGNQVKQAAAPWISADQSLAGLPTGLLVTPTASVPWVALISFSAAEKTIATMAATSRSARPMAAHGSTARATDAILAFREISLVSAACNWWALWDSNPRPAD